MPQVPQFCEYRGKNVMCGPRGMEDIQWEKYLSAKTAPKKALTLSRITVALSVTRRLCKGGWAIPMSQLLT
jgi:hypothetical protein